MSAHRSRRPSRSGESTNPKSPTLRPEPDRLASSSSVNDSTDTTSSWAATSAPPSRAPPTPVAQSPAQPYFKVPASPRTTPSTTEGSTAKQAKIAIPRLKRPHDGHDGSSKPGGRHRVTHACEPCRHRKTKCSGERPACRHCQDFKIQCYYADGKRDRVKKQFGSMTEKVADYEKLLRELMNRASLDDTVLIKSVLERAAQHDMDENMTEVSTVQSIEPDGDTELSGAESEVSAGVGSTGALDRTEEDFTRDGVKMTGFMGKNSEVTWLQRVRQEIKSDPPDDPHADRAKRIPGSFYSPQQRSDTNMPGYEAEEDLTIQDSSYHLNDLAIVSYDAVDMYEIPPTELAQTMFDIYMRRVHPSFPIVGRINLINQFAKFLQKPASRPPPKWLAILNLIFAISARYSHLIQASWRGDDRDHLIYFTRARLLAIDNETLLNHPDLQMIQIIALMSFYLMSTDQINRAWRLAGLAIRDATGLGLNMRNDSTELSNALKEIRYRVWWALYCLESRLCSMTGRVNCVNDEHCTAPLPIPMLEDEFDTEQGKRLLSQERQQSDRAPASNTHTPPVEDGSKSSSDRSRSGSKKDASKSPGGAQSQGELDWARDANPSTALFFLHFVQLCRLSQQIFNRLYNPQSLHGSWADVQQQMQLLQVQADHWYKQLPTAFDFKRIQRERDNVEGRMALGFYYYGVIQVLNRPCLCRLDRKVPNQSQKSSEFNHNAAMMCVNAACDQLALIPDEPNAIGLLGQGPWANLLNLLVQSASVLMLEISFRAHHMPERVDDLIESAKKSVRWLHALGAENLAAARAWKLCDQMLHDAVGKVGRRITGMPNTPPKSMAPGFGDRIPQPAQSGQQQSRPQAQQQYSQGQFHNQVFMPQTSMHQDFGGYNIPPPSYMGQFGSTQFDQYSMIDPGMMEFQFQEQDMGMNMNMNMEFGSTYQQSQDDLAHSGDNSNNNSNNNNNNSGSSSNNNNNNNNNNNRSGGQSFG